MRLGMTLEIATALGAITGGLTAAWLSAATLEGLFAVVLIPTAVAMWRGKSMEAPSAAAPSAEPNSRPATATADTASAAPPAVLGGRYFDEAEQRDVTYRVERLWAGMVIAFVAGNLSGLLGIGGGVFKVPALHLLCAVPIKAAAATSNFMIGVTAAASAFLYYGRGEVRPAVTAAAVLGVVAGSGLGLLVNRRVRADAVRRLFALLLLAVAGQMLFRAFSLRI
jgi:hypothetical protein